MIICFEISDRTKKGLDQLLESGDFSDYSEIIAVAVGNQMVLHERAANGQPLMMDESANAAEPKTERKRPVGSRPTRRTPETSATQPTLKEEASVPLLFLRDAAGESSIRPVAPPGDAFVVGQEVPVDRWIFGQHNKLFTAKASCRGLASLLHKAPKGVPLVKAAAEIAEYACQLGDFLRELDEEHDYNRDEALATAFPSSGPESHKARLRYSNQFVVNMNKNGQLSGLLVDLKLINTLGSKEPRISLTEAGLNFVKLENPVLDGDLGKAPHRFSEEETAFLLDHIRSNVPAEECAFRTILTALVTGARTPEGLDKILAERISNREDKPYTQAFISTQRSGAISRMVELGLIRRVREGVRVKYEPTHAGLSYVNAQTETNDE